MSNRTHPNGLGTAHHIHPSRQSLKTLQDIEYISKRH